MEQCPVEIGQILTGKYRIERVLGMGGLGIVVAATHLQLGQLVALKFMLPQAMTAPEAVQRFLREAQAAVRLQSEHVARIMDVATLDDGTPYIVMEHLDGMDLGNFLEKQGALPVATAVSFVLQACEAIAEAHAIGIIHRDLKPANLFLTRRARDGSFFVKVLDFGIAKAVSQGGQVGLTQTSAIMGSPLYMSPEQMRSSKTVDPRSDIWSLGVILYHLLAGKPPFDGESFGELCVKVLMDPLPPLPLPLPALAQASRPAAGIEIVLQRCLEKEPNARYQSVAELVDALVPFAGEALRQPTAAVAIAPAPPPAIDGPAAYGAATSPPRVAITTLARGAGEVQPTTRPRLGRAPLLAIGGGVLAVGIAVSVLVLGQGRGQGRGTENTSTTPAAAAAPSMTTASSRAEAETEAARAKTPEAAQALDAGSPTLTGAQAGGSATSAPPSSRPPVPQASATRAPLPATDKVEPSATDSATKTRENPHRRSARDHGSRGGTDNPSSRRTSPLPSRDSDPLANPE
ncbi:MAG: serine/threonine-protein kinase [Pseudomonadota bacterium]